MTIYADILFIVNLYVDYFLLLAVKRFYNLTVKTSKLLLGSALGAVFSLFSLFSFPEVVNYIFALFSALLICLITFYSKNLNAADNKKIIAKTYLSFLFISFIFSGIVYFLSDFTASAALISGKPYFQISAIHLFIFTLISYGISELIRFIRGSNDNPSLFHKIIIEHHGHTAELFAKIDTGNALKEPFSGLPVMVAEKSALTFVQSESSSYRIIPFASLSGNGLLPAFLPEKIYIKKTGKPLNCYIAVFDGNLSQGSYNSLINPEILS